MTVKHPTILWAQRSPHIYLSVEVEDMKITDLTVANDNFRIRGSRGDETYQADLQLYAALKGNECRQIATDRRVELVIPKETAEWWPRLLHDKAKVAWIKVDFDKWVDEDEEHDAENPFGDLQGADFSQFSGGFPMNLGNEPDFGDEIDDDIGELEDVDSEEGGEQNHAGSKVPSAGNHNITENGQNKVNS